MFAHRGKVLGILFVVAGTRCHTITSHEGSTHVDPPVREISQHLRRGERALRAGNLDRALAEFSAADGIELFEAPNYQVLPRVAEVYCRKGELVRAAELLESVFCMASIDEGRLPCFDVGAGAASGVRNPDVSEPCFERMCDEAYLGYYENPSDLQLAEAAKTKALAIKIKTECGSSVAK